MNIHDTGLIILVIVLTLAAMGVGFLMGAEVVRIVRDLISQASSQATKSMELDSTPAEDARSERTRRNRATVERLITKFEEKDSRSLPRARE